MGAKIAGKAARGFVKAVSVGFRPGKVTARSALPSDHKHFKADSHGVLFEDNELLELSVVSIPMHQDALKRDAESETEPTLAEQVRALVAEQLPALLKADPSLILDAIRSDPATQRAADLLLRGQEREQDESGKWRGW